MVKLSFKDRIQDLCNRGTSTMLKYLLKRVSYEFRKKLLKQRFVEIDVHNYRMIVDLNDPGISRTLIHFGTREKDHIYILNKELSSGSVIIDLGANIGYYALMEANIVGNDGYVYALEPSPSNVDMLRKNISLNNYNGIVEVYQMGGSNKTGKEKFYTSEMSNLGTFFPTKYYGESSVTKSSPSIYIKTITIPDFIVDKKPIDFIRMDIEGYEVEVFEGMMPMLENKSFSPKILFETHRPKYDDNHHSMRKVLLQMFEYGYYPKIIVSNDHPKGEFLKRGYKPEKFIDTDGYRRGIYYGVTNKDAIDFICDIGFVRAVYLERRL
jgi:FkbM family methyltransferase